MPRIYRTKGTEKLARSVNVPLRAHDLENLKLIASKRGVSHTVLARDYILEGMGAAEPA